jgi:hypothetical protein
VITFNKFADSALNIEVVHVWSGTEQKVYLKGLQALNLQVKETFDREGLEFAFPTQTIHVKEAARRAAWTVRHTHRRPRARRTTPASALHTPWAASSHIAGPLHGYTAREWPTPEGGPVLPSPTREAARQHPL